MAETTTKARTAASKPATDPVAKRVTALRRQAKTDPEAAREQAWAWIEELSVRSQTEREGATNELQKLFKRGRPARPTGQTEGMLVTWTINPLADRVVGKITDTWMPWLGKKFDPSKKRGLNTLTDSARWPAKLIWPLYSTKDSPLGRSAFDFKTYTEAGKLDPDVKVLVIDYESVPENPNLLIRQIRDELVEIVPGANLGKMLVKVPRRRELFPALYFALKSEI
ncbi:MAG TPA: hypothetical protein VMD48_00110 [Solirubrobacteraceae bacterium]|nr:hypothetical protein [Solirubrobacteraceae bacterium]